MPKGRRHSTQFKFRVALDAAKGTKTLTALAGQYELHPSQISEWKSELLKEGDIVYSTATARQRREQEALQADLYEQIGRLQMELEWLKKKLPSDARAKRALIAPEHSQLSIRRQCELIGLSRATFYYQPVPESAFN